MYRGSDNFFKVMYRGRSGSAKFWIQFYIAKLVYRNLKVFLCFSALSNQIKDDAARDDNYARAFNGISPVPPEEISHSKCPNRCE
jgi:hypothetical protein